MVHARIELTDPFGGPDLLTLVVPLSSGYGLSPEQALDLVTLSLTMARPPRRQRPDHPRTPVFASVGGDLVRGCAGARESKRFGDPDRTRRPVAERSRSCGLIN